MQQSSSGARPTVAIEVAGQRLRLAAHGDPGHLEALAAVVNQRVETIQKSAKSAPPSTLLALVALDLADELLAARRRADEAQRDAERRVGEVEARARNVEEAARQAVAEAIAEIDRALVADAESAQPGG